MISRLIWRDLNLQSFDRLAHLCLKSLHQWKHHCSIVYFQCSAMVVRHSDKWPCIHLQHAVDLDEDIKALWPWCCICSTVKWEAFEVVPSGPEETTGGLSAYGMLEMRRASLLLCVWRGKIFILHELGSSAAEITSEFSWCLLK